MLIMNKADLLSETREVTELAAPAKCDFFIDPSTGVEKGDAPFYYEKRSGDFVLRARVKPAFAKTYDAGGLLVYDGPKKWIKLAFEFTDLGCPSIVSVLTDGVSDDGNGERVEGADEVWLQVARQGDSWALHYSLDGKSWRMVRYFRLKAKAELRIGCLAQSPLGRGCRVEFRAIAVKDGAPKNLRKGK